LGYLRDLGPGPQIQEEPLSGSLPYTLIWKGQSEPTRPLLVCTNPSTQRLWMNLDSVNFWFHLGNPACKVAGPKRRNVDIYRWGKEVKKKQR